MIETRYHTTIADLLAREINPALDGLEAGFDTEQLVDRLRATGIITWDDTRQAFAYADADPDHLAFWTAVEDIATQA